MENVTFVALFCYFFCITTGTEGQIAGDVQIESCKDGLIDILEKAINTILCKGFNPEDTIRWTFKIKGSDTPVATCDSDNCTVHEADHFTVERSPRQSKLFYQQYDREVDILSTVTCTSQLGPVAGTSTRSNTCSLNVINPAELSTCTVEEDRDSGRVTGRCRFDHALSAMRGFLCIWYQEKDGQSKRLFGRITYDSLPQSPGGVCTFTSTDPDNDPGTYTYSINFYPGPGNITVNVGNIESSTSKKKTSSSIAAIVGGCVAAVVIVVVAVVIVVVKIKLRDKTYAKPTRRHRNAEPEHVYTDLHSNTATTTTTTMPSDSITTTIGDLHNATANQHRGQGKTLDTVHPNPVYVNEIQPGEESLGVQQHHHTYANDHPQTAQGDVDANRDSNPYYSEIKDTGIN